MLFVFLIYYGALNLITFIVYGLDKSAARNGKWRVSEVSLHFLSLLGGWLGAFLGQKILRHKTKKRDFRLLFWVTSLVNIILIWLFFQTF